MKARPSLLVAGAFLLAAATCPGQIDPNIITKGLSGMQRPQDPLETARKVLEIKNLQLQNERELQEIEASRLRLQRREKSLETANSANAAPLAPSDRVSIGQALGPTLFQQSGIAGLRPEQLTILDRWITAYTRDLLSRATPAPRDERDALTQRVEALEKRLEVGANSGK